MPGALRWNGPGVSGAGLCMMLALAILTVPAKAAVPQKAPADLKDITTKMDASKSGADRERWPGAAIFRARCQQCHLGQAPKAPARTFLEMMAPEAIYRALSSGIMQQQAAGLSVADRRHVAEYLSGTPFGQKVGPVAPACSGAARQFDLTAEPDLIGWGLTPGNTHFAQDGAARLELADIPRLKLKWALAFPHAVRARSQPSFAFGALYVGSQSGEVYALDAHQGCLRWRFSTSAEVRTPIVIPAGQGSLKRAFFGDLLGRVYALDALTGKELWRARPDTHPSATITAAPVVVGDTVYVGVSSLEEAIADASYNCCTFRGSVVALDAATGRVRWQRYAIEQAAQQVGTTPTGRKIFAPSGAAIWSAPTVDTKHGLLYVGTGNNYTGPADDRSDAILALDLHEGTLRWAWQIVGGDAWNVGCMVGLASCPEHSGPDTDIGSGVIFGSLPDGQERLFIGLKSGLTLSVDPKTHDRPLWSQRLGRGSIQGGVQFGMAFDGERLFVPIADMGNSLDASTQARDTSAGPSRPGLYALNASSGELLWHATPPDTCQGRPYCDPGILAAVTAVRGAVFAGHMDGWLRAYEASSGRVLWQFDTTLPQTSLTATSAKGGSIGAAGPVVHDGMVYVNSGYGLYFHMPGNALLAFSVNGR